ncbi:ferredoxin--NADP(+) reductase [Rhodospirillum rubrum]|uniref:ferredoxin--NADP reductase n=1 Tax=Rhodospirillum rubrum TaxID=1085 RepID=UPI001903DF5F|nr:ferredoxin--NADP reductase [Rhodospirillum rubrum]MBK1666321.1 ferredoxin--NADP(+) reductase [Rhodospirillum rubrum]MBK1678523.1 ferredoxin--NADP(+) reductase [Rhodospirillum rubrum]
MSTLLKETVTEVHHWTETLFSFKTTRDQGFRFDNGQFTMVGIEVEGRPLLRAYSMVSANHEENLEFFSIKVPNGPLTSRLQNIQVGDTILVSRKPTGTLVVDNLLPGKILWLLGTGTGLAPFLSIIKDPAVYEGFDKVVLVHGCRFIAELAYEEEITHLLPDNEFLGDMVREKLIYYPTVTREPFRNQGRITTLMETAKITADLGLPAMSTERDRVMMCGSPAMLADMKAWLEAHQFREGNTGEPGHFVIEKAFVEK